MGYWQNGTGNTACTACIPGKWSNRTNQSSDTCISCTAGRYNPNNAQSNESSACSKCPTGMFMPPSKIAQTSVSACEPCHEGTFSNETGKTLCHDCEKATYQDSTGKDSCKSCPAGFIMPAKKSIYCQDCSPGKREDGTRLVCENCAKGKYTLLRHQTECIVCLSEPTRKIWGNTGARHAGRESTSQTTPPTQVLMMRRVTARTDQSGQKS